jgi:AraC-like DNA-binding protein
VNWIGIISLIGAVQGAFIAYLVLAHARQRRANFWLGLFVLCYAALCLGDTFRNSGWLSRFPDLAAISDFGIFLLGPLLYQYVRILTGNSSLGDLIWLHFVPAEILLLMQLVFHLLPLEEKRQILIEEAASQGRFDALQFLAAIQILAYLVAALLLLRKYAASLKDNYSSIEMMSFNWLRNLLVIMAALWLVWAAGLLVHSRAQAVLDYVGFPVAAYVLAAFALRAPQVLVRPDEGGMFGESGELLPGNAAPEAKTPEAPAQVSLKYQKSRLPDGLLDRYQEKLTALMVEQKPYCEGELTLSGLAGRLGISRHHLSQVLNERLGVSFFDYVNNLRVEEAKRLLSDPRRAQQSVLELGFEAGFRSKSSFNAVFRQATGKSPSQYRDLTALPSGPHPSRTSSPSGRDDSLDPSR